MVEISSVDSFIEAVEAASPATRHRLAATLLLADIDVLLETGDEMSFEDRTTRNLEAVTRLMRVQSRNIEELSDNIQNLTDAVNDRQREERNFRGNYAQSAALAADLDIAALFAPVHGLDPQRIESWRLRRRKITALTTITDEEMASLQLRGDNPLGSLRRPDLIAGVNLAQDGRDAPKVYFITVEASYVVEQRDYDRAVDNAKIVRRMTGRPAHPVVAGVELGRDLVQEARNRIFRSVGEVLASNDPLAVYWHILDPENLQPPSPG